MLMPKAFFDESAALDIAGKLECKGAFGAIDAHSQRSGHHPDLR